MVPKRPSGSDQRQIPCGTLKRAKGRTGDQDETAEAAAVCCPSAGAPGPLGVGDLERARTHTLARSQPSLGSHHPEIPAWVSHCWLGHLFPPPPTARKGRGVSGVFRGGYGAMTLIPVSMRGQPAPGRCSESSQRQPSPP